MQYDRVNITMKDYLYKVDWDSTRPIYRKLSDELHVLTNAYSIEINDRTKLMLDHLILAIDEVDKAVDPLPTLAERNDLTDSILSFLSNDELTWQHNLASPILIQSMQMLKEIVMEQDVKDRFHKAVTEIFDYTEKKRHTKSESELIDLIMLEGKATAELPLTIMNIDSEHKFGCFFNNLCRLMGIADLVIDASQDYQENYIAIKPRLGLYLKLNTILVTEGLKLIWNFPHKFQFLNYCIKFSVLLLFEKDE